MNNKLKCSAFWLSATAGVVVLLNSLAKVFNFKVDEVAITSVATSVIGLLVVLGVLSKPDKNKNETEETKIEKEQQENTNQQNEQEENIEVNVENKYDCGLNNSLNDELEKVVEEIESKSKNLTKK